MLNAHFPSRIESFWINLSTVIHFGVVSSAIAYGGYTLTENLEHNLSMNDIFEIILEDCLRKLIQKHLWQIYLKLFSIKIFPYVSNHVWSLDVIEFNISSRNEDSLRE